MMLYVYIPCLPLRLANPIIIKPCNGTSCVPRCRPCPPGRFCPAVCIEES
ncbi:hypothetical protein GDO81_014676 [Engystomops pustulosus]|uniref:Uncharacterized protein n=1 Tax=Engystomops pustulosus TaxID=76066 RepID=A0AAV7BC94_ENGPU|nr:hypothetical protein GDO81_014676 [Engystomops pustulosus]